MTIREGKALQFQAVYAGYANGIQEGDITPILLFDQNEVPFGRLQPLTYVGIVTQTGVNNPIGTEVLNTTGATIAWARTGVGTYTITASSPVFTEDYTVAFTGSDNVNIVWTSATILTVSTTADDGVTGIPAPADAVLSGTSIKVEVYQNG